MTTAGWIQILAFVAVLTALTPLSGNYMARVYQGERVALDTIVSPAERVIYRLLRVDAREQHGWKEYVAPCLRAGVGDYFGDAVEPSLRGSVV